MLKKLCFIVLAIYAIQAKATTHVVTLSTDNYDNPQVGMLRYYIDNASSGDTIIFNVANVMLDTSLRITGISQLTIDGGAGVIIDGNQRGRVFNISFYSADELTLKNLTIQNGLDSDSYAWGGGLYGYVSNGKLLVENCTFINNQAIASGDGQGGAVRTDGGTFKNCYFLNNSVSGTTSILGGGAIQATGGTFINCVIAGNSANNGGGVFATGGVSFYNCTITQNEAGNADGGGGINVENSCVIKNSIIYNNLANGAVNNVYNHLNSSTLSYCAFNNGDTQVGSSGNIGLTSSPFLHAGADSLNIFDGSACQNAGTSNGVTILAKDIAGNDRVNGGIIDVGAYEYNPPVYTAITVDNNSSDVSVVNSLSWAIAHADSACVITFDGDYTIAVTNELVVSDAITIDGTGHNIVLDGGDNNRIFRAVNTSLNDTIILQNILFQNAHSTSHGGAIYIDYQNKGEFYITNCAFEKNKSNNSGGAVYVYHNATFTNCTFAQNTAQYYGGAVHTEYDAIFLNSVFYGNYAPTFKNAPDRAQYLNCALDDYIPNNIQLWYSPFVGGTGSDRLHLNDSSFCANEGFADTLKIPSLDLSANTRVLNDTIDIGAYESNYFTQSGPELYNNIVVNNNSFDASLVNSLPWALKHADDNCVITFDNDYTINVSHTINVGDKNVTIDGGENEIILDGGDSISLLKVWGVAENTVTLNSIQFQNAYSKNSGGAIYIDVKDGGYANINNCLFKDNHSRGNGGAIYITEREGVQITNSIFDNNYALGEGGALCAFDARKREIVHGNTYTNCTFVRNKAEWYGGGVSTRSINIFTNCIFYDNTTPDNTPIWAINGAEMHNCASDVNLSRGKAIRLFKSPFEEGTYQLREGTVCSNAGTFASTYAGTLISTLAYDINGNPRVINDTIDLGALESNYFSVKPLEKLDHIIVSNNAFHVDTAYSFLWALSRLSDGGKITFDGDYTIHFTRQIELGIQGLTIDGEENTVVFDGGDSTRLFVFEDGASFYPEVKQVFISNITFQRGNGKYGGAIYRDYFTSARYYISNCLFNNNTAVYGGALYLSDGCNISNCVFINNSSSNEGGAAYLNRNITMYNSSFSNNFTRNNGGGLATRNSRIENCILFGNQSTYGNNDLYNRDNSTIINYSASGNDLSSYGTGNLLLTESPFAGGSLYDSLQLKSGSVAIDAGSADTTGFNLPNNDFSGNSRIVNSRIDMGAYEYFDYGIEITTNKFGDIHPNPVTVLTGDTKTLTVVPKPGCRLDSVWVDETLVDSTTSYTFSNITANHSIRAKCVPDTFNITAVQTGKGLITPSENRVTYFDTTNFTFKADTGYSLVEVSLAGIDVTSEVIASGSIYTYTATNVFAHSELEATFALDTFKIVSVTKGEGSVSINKAQFTYEDTLKVNIVPVTGCKIDSAQFSGTDILPYLEETSNGYEYSINKLLQNDTLYLNFVPDTFFLSIEVVGNGMVNIIDPNKEIRATDTLVTKDSYIDYMLIPDSGFIIDSIILISADTSISLEPYTYLYLRGFTSDQTLRITFKPESVNSVSSFAMTETEIYPNPAKDFLNIKLKGMDDYSSLELRIFNSLGSFVYNSTILSNETLIDLKSFSKGVYLITIQNENSNVFTRTLIIE